MDTINIGLIGFGNIGTGLVNAINQNAPVMGERLGVKLRLARIADADIKRKRDAEYDQSILTNDANELINDPNIHIVVELVGGLEPARTFVEKALKNGKHVVSANKAMLATFGGELWQTARENNVALLYEASVGGGIPIIRALQTGLAANNIQKVYGILNGTCNYILTHMEQDGRAFETVLAEAQAHGFAEPDPTYDVEGYDTAHKTAILASLAFQQDVRFSDVFVEGISRLKPVDLENACKLGYREKLLGIARRDEDGRVEARVHPTLLPRTSLLSNVNGVFNGILVEGDLVGQTLFYGRGAGQLPTSSAILSDIMSIASDMARGVKANTDDRLRVTVGEKNLRPISELETSYYLRVRVVDKPGAMAVISGVLAKHSISINSMLQTGERNEGKAADVIIVTHRTREAEVQAALKEIAETDVAQDKPFILRVEEDL
jgi:homoserine dehydrogenase